MACIWFDKLFIWFYLVFMWLYMVFYVVLYDFYFILHCFYMILYGFFMILYCFYEDTGTWNNMTAQILFSHNPYDKQIKISKARARTHIATFNSASTNFHIICPLPHVWPSWVRPNVRISSRTFEILAKSSNFWPNVRISGRMFAKIHEKSVIQGSQNGLPEFLVEAKFIFEIWILIFRGLLVCLCTYTCMS